MSPNPERVITTLDKHLDHEVSLVIYGRGALCLGFEGGRERFGATEDVDGIVTLSQLKTLEQDGQFWEAVERTNRELETDGLYITHLFQEDQVFLRAAWESKAVPVTRPVTRWLELRRPSAVDLILTKMMRGDDPQDMSDVEFLIAQDQITPTQIERSFEEAVIPDVQELRDAFERAAPVVREIAQRRGFC